MTYVLICSGKEKLDFSAISDVMLTSDDEGESEPGRYPLPVGNKMIRGFQHTGTVQKTAVISKNFLVGWAGRYIEAFSILKEAQDLANRFPADSKRVEEFLRRACDTCKDVELSVAVFRNDPENPSVDVFGTSNMKVVDQGSIMTQSIGTGSSWHIGEASFVKSGEFESKTRNEDLLSLEFSLREITNLQLGTDGDFFPYLRFGGWYEFVLLSRNGFDKFPYAIHSFVVIRGELHHIRTVRSSYQFGKLIVVSFEVRGLKKGEVNFYDDVFGDGWIIKPIVAPSKEDERAFWDRSSEEFFHTLLSQCSFSINVLFDLNKKLIGTSTKFEDTVKMSLNEGFSNLQMRYDAKTMDYLKSGFGKS